MAFRRSKSAMRSLSDAAGKAGVPWLLGWRLWVTECPLTTHHARSGPHRQCPVLASPKRPRTDRTGRDTAVGGLLLVHPLPTPNRSKSRGPERGVIEAEKPGEPPGQTGCTPRIMCAPHPPGRTAAHRICRQGAFQRIMAIENKGPGAGSPFVAGRVSGSLPHHGPWRHVRLRARQREDTQ